MRKHESRCEPFFIGNFTLVEPFLYLSVAVSSELYLSAGRQPPPARRFLLVENDKVRDPVASTGALRHRSRAARAQLVDSGSRHALCARV